MEIGLFALLVAAAGGFFGAAIGGLHAFVFTGLMAIVGGAIAMAGAGTAFLNDIALGPFFGPHVAFAGGVAAVAFAARRSAAVVGERAAETVATIDATAVSHPGRDTETGSPDRTPSGDPRTPGGKDIGSPLIALERPTVLLVGAAAGMLGYVVEAGISAVPWFGENTDSVALTVLLLGIATRLAFGTTGLFARTTPVRSGESVHNRFAPVDESRWIRYHERFLPNTLLGLFVGLLAAGVALTIVENFPQLADDTPTFMFGVSAFSLLFLSLGMSFPVTHHMSIVAGVAAIAFLPVLGDPTGALLVGAVAGMLAGWAGEFFARIWHNGGDTQVDPPAAAIWPLTTVAQGLAALLS